MSGQFPAFAVTDAYYTLFPDYDPEAFKLDYGSAAFKLDRTFSEAGDSDWGDGIA
jgi:hypothetical protein